MIEIFLCGRDVNVCVCVAWPGISVLVAQMVGRFDSMWGGLLRMGKFVGEGPEEAAEGLRVRVDFPGELVDGHRAVGEGVGDPELGRHVDALAEPVGRRRKRNGKRDGAAHVWAGLDEPHRPVLAAAGRL